MTHLSIYTVRNILHEHQPQWKALGNTNTDKRCLGGLQRNLSTQLQHIYGKLTYKLGKIFTSKIVVQWVFNVNFTKYTV